MKNAFNKIRNWIFRHKIISTILLLIMALAAYKVTQGFSAKSAQVSYITAAAEKGDVVSSVTGTGQVSTSNKLDVVSEVAGDVTAVPVKLGDTVKKWQALVYVDARDSQMAVQSAELSLENAKLSYEKAQKQANDQIDTSSASDLNKAYDTAYTEVSNTLVDIPDIVSGTDSIFYNSAHSAYFNDLDVRSYGGDTAVNYKYEAGRSFDQSKKDYNTVFAAYKSVNKSDRQAMNSLIQNTYDTTKELHAALTSTYNAINYLKDRIPASFLPAQIETDKTSLNSYISKLNTHITALSNDLTAIENAQNSGAQANLDLKSAELQVANAEDSLQKAQEDLANHTIRAPFDGVVGQLNVEKGDKVTSSGTVATMITDQKVAEVSLNEVDVASVKLGQKAGMTFDAIPDLKISGTVSQIDLLGTVNQGVVTYTVKINFDSNDDRVRPGMSLSSNIITDTKQNVIRVPNAAVKTQGKFSYVETLDSAGKVVRLPVQTGLSNDQFTEIVSGLNEGEKFITRTVSKTTQTTSSAGLFGGSNRNAASGGSFRALQGR